ncbi:hypothetical protein Tco_1150001 [Tanacetum coccineum]
MESLNSNSQERAASVETNARQSKGKFTWNLLRSQFKKEQSINEKCSGTKSDKQDTSSSSGNYITHVVDEDIRPVNDQVPFAKVDSNTTPDSTNICHKGEEIDQNAKKCQVSCPSLDPSFDNMTT